MLKVTGLSTVVLIGTMSLGMPLNVSALEQRSLERLSDEAIAQRTQSLPGWKVENQTLICTYEFENFVESIAFVNQLVDPAEHASHHPDLTISYNRVTVALTTHDAGGLTSLDMDLAATIAAIGDRPCIQ